MFPQYKSQVQVKDAGEKKWSVLKGAKMWVTEIQDRVPEEHWISKAEWEDEGVRIFAKRLK